MNDDNDTNRRMVEMCFRTNKRMVNPIVDWTDEDVWQFLNENNIPHCCLYDPPYNYTRLGCIGCPLAGTKEMLRDFERYPKYKELYIRAFQRMIDNHPGEIRILDPNSDTKFKLFDEAPENFGGGGFGEIGSTRAIDDNPDVDGSDSGKIGGGTQESCNSVVPILGQRTGQLQTTPGKLLGGDSDGLVQMVDGIRRLTDEQEQKPYTDSSSTTVTTDDNIYIYISGKQRKQYSTDGSGSGCAEYRLGEAMFRRWLKAHYC